MNAQNNIKASNKIIFQTVAIILFIAVCTYYIMKLIDNESDSLSLFFIGFGIAVVFIVLFAVYLKYVYDIYLEIKEAKKNSKSIDISTLEIEKMHMRVVRNNTNRNQKNKASKRKNKR